MGCEIMFLGLAEPKRRVNEGRVSYLGGSLKVEIQRGLCSGLLELRVHLRQKRALTGTGSTSTLIFELSRLTMSKICAERALRPSPRF